MAKRFSKEAKRLARKLEAHILKNDPLAITPENLDAWTLEADKLLRLDKRPLWEAEKVLLWAMSNSFWRTNILSIPKFRKRYAQLKAQMRGQKNKERRREAREQAREQKAFRFYTPQEMLNKKKQDQRGKP